MTSPENSPPQLDQAAVNIQAALQRADGLMYKARRIFADGPRPIPSPLLGPCMHIAEKVAHEVVDTADREWNEEATLRGMHGAYALAKAAFWHESFRIDFGSRDISLNERYTNIRRGAHLLKELSTPTRYAVEDMYPVIEPFDEYPTSVQTGLYIGLYMVGLGEVAKKRERQAVRDRKAVDRMALIMKQDEAAADRLIIEQLNKQFFENDPKD